MKHPDSCASPFLEKTTARNPTCGQYAKIKMGVGYIWNHLNLLLHNMFPSLATRRLSIDVSNCIQVQQLTLTPTTAWLSKSNIRNKEK